MKKIKKVWEENKVLAVLAIILAVCLTVFVVVAMTYFYGSSDSVYGNRLDAIKDTPLSDSLLKDIKEKLSTEESVKNVSFNLKGIVLYINIEFASKTEMNVAKEIAASTLQLFSEEVLNKYDLQYTISCLSDKDFVGYTLMGAKNAGRGDSIIWNNYNLKAESN